MAFAVTARHSGNGGQSSAQNRALGLNGTTSPTTPTADSLLFCFGGSENDNHTTVPVAQTPTGGGWTYTQRALSGYSTAYEWNGATGYRISQALYTAPISGIPGSHTVTIDNYSGTNVGFYSGICCDVTGHDPSGTVLYYANGANVSIAADNVAGTVTLGAGAVPSGRQVLVSFYAGADSGGVMATPTLGGRAMSPVTVQSNSGYTMQGVWKLVTDGTESNNVITCSDLGQQVGNWTAIAAVIPPAAGGGSNVSGTGVANLPGPTATAAGLRSGHGSGASTLPGAVAAAAATVTVLASAAAALPPVTATATGLREGHASGAATLPAVVGHLFGSGTDPIMVAALPGPVGLMTGTRETFGVGAAALPGLVATASGLRAGHGSGAATLPTVAAVMAGLRATTGSGSTMLPQIVATIDVGSNGGEEPIPPEEDDALTLGDLMDARATHESVMLDSISIRHPGMVDGEFDPELGYAPAEPRAPYYTGKAIVQARQIQGGEISPAGVGTLTQLGYAVKVPVSVTEVAPEDIVTVHESMEPAHNGVEIVVRNVESNTLVTARRMTGLRYEPSTP